MSSIAEAVDPVALCVREGLAAGQKTLPPWLFYDARGSELFERITELPEYYLTRTERALLVEHAESILLHLNAQVTVVELGAGTATKTGVLLRAATRLQRDVLYQPIDVSASALEEAKRSLETELPEVTVRPEVANYVTDPIRIAREAQRKVLALYIGSSIGNFSPADARCVLRRLRGQMQPDDALLLGTDLAPGATKSVATLLAAYDDAAGVTAAFNRNMLVRLNRELGANFAVDAFAHRARWNAAESRIEMHLESMAEQTVQLPPNGAGPELTLRFRKGETIHTENSYKFSRESVRALLGDCGFAVDATFEDARGLYALTSGRAR